jgi:hypothetical protein
LRGWDIEANNEEQVRCIKMKLAQRMGHTAYPRNDWNKKSVGRSQTERFSRSEADVFDRWPSSDAFERCSFCQRRGAFLLRSVPKTSPMRRQRLRGCRSSGTQ